MLAIVVFACALAAAVVCATVLLVRGRVRRVWLWSACALGIYQIGAMLAWAALEAVYAPELVPESAAAQFFRDGLISLNQYERLVAMNQHVQYASVGAGAVVALVFALAARSWLPRNAAGAEHEAPSGAQLVGESCAACARRVAVEADAQRCERCSAPLHRACRADHTCGALP